MVMKYCLMIALFSLIIYTPTYALPPNDDNESEVLPNTTTMSENNCKVMKSVIDTLLTNIEQDAKNSRNIKDFSFVNYRADFALMFMKNYEEYC